MDKNFEPKWPMIVRVAAEALAWLAVSIFMVWAFAALCFDVRHEGLRILAAVLFAVAVLVILFAVRESGCVWLPAQHVAWWCCRGVCPSNQATTLLGKRMFRELRGRRFMAIRW